MTAEKVRILIVDDHPIVRRVLTLLLQEQSEFEVVGEAESAEEALNQLEDLAPDVVLMDLSLPGMSGTEATRIICRRFPAAAVIAVSSHPVDPFEAAAMKAGARGFVQKDETVSELVPAIQTVLNGDLWTHESQWEDR